LRHETLRCPAARFGRTLPYTAFVGGISMAAAGFHRQLVLVACLFDMPPLPAALEQRSTSPVAIRRRVGALERGGVQTRKETAMRVSKRPIAAASVAIACLLAVPSASAQTQSPAQPPGQSDQSVSEQKLDAAAAAMLQVASLKQDYQQRIVAAAPSDKERIAAEAMGALTKAVTDQGLTVEEYTSILEVAQNDSGVREKLRQRIAPSNK